MVTAVLVMMVASALVVASVALATHSDGQSGDQRNATAALHAADYGLHLELESLAASPVGGVPVAPSCTAIPAGLLPNTSLPAQWFSVTLSGCSIASLTRTIVATGYAAGSGAIPAASPPSGAVKRTVVAHVTLQPAGAISNGGYGFPDAITAVKGTGTGQTGAITASVGPLSVSGLSGNSVSIRADGAVNLSGGTLTLASSQISNSLSAWGSVTLSGTTVTGNVSSASSVSLGSSSVSGNVLATSVTNTSSSVSGATRIQTSILPSQPPVPLFPSPADPGWANWLALTGGASAQTACPGSATLSGLYVLTGPCTISSSTLTPIAGYSAVAIILNAAANLTITVPTNVAASSQLYLIVTNGNLNLTGSGTALSVFGYASGSVTVAGTIVGQLVGGNVTTSASANLIAQPVSTLVSGTPTFPPDFAFPSLASGPAPTGFVPQINDEYLCAPGVTTAC